MKKPEQFLGCPGVIYTAMAVVVALYASIGFFGYLKYGDEVKEGSITLNLDINEMYVQNIVYTVVHRIDHTSTHLNSITSCIINSVSHCMKISSNVS